MKKILILLAAIMLPLFGFSQTIIGDRGYFRDSVYVNGKWVKAVSSDTTLGDGADNVIPTQGAVKGAIRHDADSIAKNVVSDSLSVYNPALTFQQITDNGNTTTNNISVNSISIERQDNQNGDVNMGVGINVLNNAVSGLYNSAFGVNVMNEIEGGKDNTGVGVSALVYLRNGDKNTAIGSGSAASTTDGSFNTAVGAYAMNFNFSGSNNVAVGAFAGQYDNMNNEGGNMNRSIFLGSYTTTKSIGSSNEIVIGYNANGHGTNTAVFGNSNIDSSFFRGIINTSYFNNSSQDSVLSTDQNGNLILKEIIDSTKVASMISDSLTSASAGKNLANSDLVQSDGYRVYSLTGGKGIYLVDSILGNNLKMYLGRNQLGSIFRLSIDSIALMSRKIELSFHNNSTMDSVLTTNSSGKLQLVNLADKIAPQIHDSLTNIPRWNDTTNTLATQHDVKKFIRADSLANITAMAIGTYTLELSDINKYFQCNGSADKTITIPAESTADFAIGSQIYFIQSGSGYINFVPANGVTIHNTAGVLPTQNGALETRTQYSVCQLLKTGPDTWLLFGDVVFLVEPQ